MQHGVKRSRIGGKLRCGSFAIGRIGESMVFYVFRHGTFYGCCFIGIIVDFKKEKVSDIVFKVAFLLTLRMILRIIFLIWYCGVVKWIT